MNNDELVIYEWEYENKRSDEKITIMLLKYETINIKIDNPIMDADVYGCGGSASIELTKNKAKILAENLIEWIG
jgi:hypothetical protein